MKTIKKIHWEREVDENNIWNWKLTRKHVTIWVFENLFLSLRVSKLNAFSRSTAYNLLFILHNRAYTKESAVSHTILFFLIGLFVKGSIYFLYTFSLRILSKAKRIMHNWFH